MLYGLVCSHCYQLQVLFLVLGIGVNKFKSNHGKMTNKVAENKLFKLHKSHRYWVKMIAIQKKSIVHF